jgi:ABC-type amino acid transport substrate-binding protein
MRKIISALVVCLAFLLPAGAMAAHFDVVYPKISANGDPRDPYFLAVLDLAMKKSGADYSVKSTDAAMERGRYLQAIAVGEEINLVWTSMSAEIEKTLRPIRIPIFRGLLGHRISLINKSRQADFETVKTLDDLKKFTAIQGLGWGDVKILSSAGLKVEEAKFDSTYKMLDANRVDYFPRGANEAFAELALHEKTEPNLMVDKHLDIVYKSDIIFYTNKANEALASTIEKGLLAAYEDGSFMKLFNESPLIQNTLKEAGLDKRVRIEIPNPVLSDEDKAIPAKFWMTN